jgi:hypothetical protein
MTLGLSEVVKSPKRAVKKMLRKLNKDRSKQELGTDQELDYDTIHIPDMDPLDPIAGTEEDAYLGSSTLLLLMRILVLVAHSSPRIREHY